MHSLGREPVNDGTPEKEEKKTVLNEEIGRSSEGGFKSAYLRNLTCQRVSKSSDLGNQIQFGSNTSPSQIHNSHPNLLISSLQINDLIQYLLFKN
jgi:hypothetical protein